MTNVDMMGVAEHTTDAAILGKHARVARVVALFDIFA